MPTKLRNLKVKRVALVDAPANQGAQITLWKRAESRRIVTIKAAVEAESLIARVKMALGPVDALIGKDEHGEPPTFGDALFARKLRTFWEEMYAHTGALQETVDGIVRSDATDKQGLVEAAIKQFTGSLNTSLLAAIQLAEADVEKVGRKIAAERAEKLRRAMKTIRDILEEAGMADDPKAAKAKTITALKATGHAGDLSDAKLETMTQAELDSALATAQVAKQKADDAAAAKKKADDDAAAKKRATDAAGEEVAKQLVEMRKQVDDANARATAAETVAKQERDTRVLKEFEAICVGYTALGIDPAKDAPIFKALAEKDPTGWARVQETFKRQLEVLKTNLIFAELGTGLRGAEGEKPADQQIDELAKAKIAKNDKLGYRQAVDEVMAENPALAEKWRRGGKVGAETHAVS